MYYSLALKRPFIFTQMSIAGTYIRMSVMSKTVKGYMIQNGMNLQKVRFRALSQIIGEKEFRDKQEFANSS